MDRKQRTRVADCVALDDVTCIHIASAALQLLDNRWMSAVFDAEAVSTVLGETASHAAFSAFDLAPGAGLQLDEVSLVIVTDGASPAGYAAVGGYSVCITGAVAACEGAGMHFTACPVRLLDQAAADVMRIGLCV